MHAHKSAASVIHWEFHNLKLSLGGMGEEVHLSCVMTSCLVVQSHQVKHTPGLGLCVFLGLAKISMSPIRST